MTPRPNRNGNKAKHRHRWQLAIFDGVRAKWLCECGAAKQTTTGAFLPPVDDEARVGL